MRAVRFHTTGTPDVLQIDELPMPAASAGEVLIRVEASGVNFADTVRRRGDFYPAPTILPCITGGELVGIVEATGEGVDAALTGSRVFSFVDGTCAEYVVAPAAATLPFPDGLEPATGIALLVQGLTAELILAEAAPVQPGQSVFIEGAAGGVGALAVQLAKLHGAGIVIGGAGSAAKRDVALALGADHAIDYRRPGWSAEVNALTDGRGVDLALNMAGAEAFDEALGCLAWRGTIVVFGSASGTPPRLQVERMFARSLNLTAFLLTGYLADRDLIARTLENLAGHVDAGRLEVRIAGRYPLDEAAEAHRALESQHSTGKLVIEP